MSSLRVPGTALLVTSTALHARTLPGTGEHEARDVLGKAGWAARGALYVVTAVLATRIATGGGSEEASHHGALQAVAEQPFGKALLAALTIGLSAYAVWRFIEAWRGRDHKAFERLNDLGSGIVYVGLAAGATAILLGGGSGSDGSGGGEQKAKGLTAEVLGWPMGPWLVGGAGIVICAIGLYSLKRGVGRDFMDDVDLRRVSEGGRRAIEMMGIFGQCARGLVFGLIGWFVVKAAMEFNPDEAKGLDGALHELAAAPEGPALLWAAALGLLAFGVFCLLRARYAKAT